MSDILFVESRKKFGLNLNFNLLERLSGNKIAVAATVQYLDLLPFVKNYLEGLGKKVIVQKGAYYDGHVVGCQPQAFDLTCDSFLLLCDGKFHALNNALIINREIFVFDGENLLKVSKSEIEKYQKKINLKKNKFLINEKIGLLVSNKIGQKSLAIEQVKENIEKLGKKCYIFECDNIDISEFENFNDIKIFVNTACFGLGIDDNRIINLTDILEFFKFEEKNDIPKSL